MLGKKSKHSSQPSKFHRWFHDHQSSVFFASAIAFIISAGLVVLAVFYQAPSYSVDQSRIPIKKPAPPAKIYSPLTGVEVADQATAERPVTAIMIENSPDARPQSGLKEAGVVYEAIAEGGITRFVALYQEARPALVGPVRSVRPYYVEWAAAYDPSMAHVGGSAKALEMIRSGIYGVDIDQFFNDGSYWRATDRYAPHNVYTSFDKLDALNASKGKQHSTFTGFDRKDETPAAAPNATAISINFSSQSYNVSYAYDKASNSYLRSEGGAPHQDREAGQITPKVAVAIKVPMTYAMEDGYREQIPTAGTGQGYIFQDGTVQEITWSKAGPTNPMQLLDAAGKSVPLNRGQVWISAIPNDQTVSWQ